jgi:AcrR family transcriptional regulator
VSTVEETGRRETVEAAILAAAESLLAEGSSFAALSVEAIARRAQIGRTAFYFYFRDKREVLMRLAEEASAELYEQADLWWHGEGDAMEQLRSSLGHVVELYLRHAAVLRVVSEAATYDDEIRRFWQALVGRFIDATRERIERDQAAGMAAPVPPRATAAALVWMCDRTLYELACGDRAGDRGAIVEALTQIFLRAIYGRLP